MPFQRVKYLIQNDRTNCASLDAISVCSAVFIFSWLLCIKYNLRKINVEEQPNKKGNENNRGSIHSNEKTYHEDKSPQNAADGSGKVGIGRRKWNLDFFFKINIQFTRQWRITKRSNAIILNTTMVMLFYLLLRTSTYLSFTGKY